MIFRPTPEEKQKLEAIRLGALGPVARQLNKRISLPISFVLAKWRIHPHFITVFNMGVGFSSGFFVAQGDYFNSLIGGALFQAASILDGCDGEVAKLNQQTSKTGELLDTIGDNGSLLSFFLGLLVAFSKNHSTSLTMLVTFLLLGGLGLLLGQIISFLKKNTESASLATFDKVYLSKLDSPLIRYGRVFLRKDVFSLVFFLSAIVGLLPIWVYLATFGLWVANGVIWYAPKTDTHL